MTALMDFLSTRRLQLATDSWQHVSATVQAVLLATLLSVAIGVAVYRSRSGSAVATGRAKVTVAERPGVTVETVQRDDERDREKKQRMVHLQENRERESRYLELQPQSSPSSGPTRLA